MVIERAFEDKPGRTSDSEASSHAPLLEGNLSAKRWNEEGEDACEQGQRKIPQRQLAVIIISSGVLSSLLTTLLLLVVLPTITLPLNRGPCESGLATSTLPAANSTVEPLTCGSTIEEAQLKGCAFDQVTDSWLPLQCSRVGLDDFLEKSGRGTPWEYYTDQNRTQRIHDLATTHGPYWTTEKEHLTHCAFMLVRLADAWAHPGRRLDSKSGSFGHGKHCAMLLLERSMYSPTIDVMNSDGEIMVGQC
ncbi:hypothetical protein B0J11DRAFT_452870 [Dendryphion nanum]|uniref:Uncharacterized protein n=1 Tax=Dendryphion nanum TaxID=256645 RepID=A0A9P9IXV1_9PLEO|nr:hypothetical protein B0J11DRAFT_452870 [Dendryphion nanum]